MIRQPLSSVPDWERPNIHKVASSSTGNRSNTPLAGTPTPTSSRPDPPLASQTTNYDTFSNIPTNTPVHQPSLVTPRNQWKIPNGAIGPLPDGQYFPAEQMSRPPHMSITANTFQAMPQAQSSLDSASQVGYQIPSSLSDVRTGAITEPFQQFSHVSILDGSRRFFQDVHFVQDDNCDYSVIYPQTLRRLGLVSILCPEGVCMHDQILGTVQFPHFITVLVKIGSYGPTLEDMLVYDDSVPFHGIGLTLGSRFMRNMAAHQMASNAIAHAEVLTPQNPATSCNNMDGLSTTAPGRPHDEASTYIGSSDSFLQGMFSPGIPNIMYNLDADDSKLIHRMILTHPLSHSAATIPELPPIGITTGCHIL